MSCFKIEVNESEGHEAIVNADGLGLKGLCSAFLKQPTLGELYDICSAIKRHGSCSSLQKFIEAMTHEALVYSRNPMQAQEALLISSLIVNLGLETRMRLGEDISDAVTSALNRTPSFLNLEELSAVLHLLESLTKLVDTTTLSKYCRCNLLISLERFIQKLKSPAPEILIHKAAETVSIVLRKHAKRNVKSGGIAAALKWTSNVYPPEFSACCMLGIISRSALGVRKPNTSTIEQIEQRIEVIENICCDIIRANWRERLPDIEKFLLTIASALDSPNSTFAGLFISEFLRASLSLSWEVQTVTYTSFLFRVFRIIYTPVAKFCEGAELDPFSQDGRRGDANMRLKTVDKFEPATDILELNPRHTLMLRVKGGLIYCLLHIRELSDQLACNSYLLESYQEDLFSLVEVIVQSDPSFFNIIWFQRINPSTNTSCYNSLFNIAWTYWRATDDGKPLEEVSRHIMIGESGVRIKRQVLKTVCLDFEAFTRVFKWSCLLQGVASREKPVATYALSISQDALKVKLFALALCSCLSVASASDYEKDLTFRGFCILAAHLSNIELERSQLTSLRTLVSRFFELGKLSEAAVLLQHLGGECFPQSWLMKGLGILIAPRSSWHIRTMWLESLIISTSRKQQLSMSLEESSKVTKALFNLLKTCEIGSIRAISRLMINIHRMNRAAYEHGVGDDVPKLLDALLSHAVNTIKNHEGLKNNDAIRLIAILGIASHLDKSRTALIKIFSALRNKARKARKVSQPGIIEVILQTVLSICQQHHRKVLAEAIEIFLELESGLKLEVRIYATCLLMSFIEMKRRHPTQKNAGLKKLKTNYGLAASKCSTTAQIAYVLETKLIAYAQRQLPLAARLLCQQEDPHALRLISQCLQLRIVIPNDFIPLVVTTCFSRSRPTAELALRTAKLIAAANPVEFSQAFAKGLASVKSPTTADHALLRIIWGWLTSPAKSLLIEKLAGLLVTSRDQSLLRFIIKGIACAGVGSRNARILAKEIDEAVCNVDTQGSLLRLFSQWLVQEYGLFKVNVLHDESLNLQTLLQ